MASPRQNTSVVALTKTKTQKIYRCGAPGVIDTEGGVRIVRFDQPIEDRDRQFFATSVAILAATRARGGLTLDTLQPGTPVLASVNIAVPVDGPERGQALYSCATLLPAPKA